jgi:hypothetical protein
LSGALLPGVQFCRAFASALAARALLHVWEGRVEDAWQDLLACHRLGRLVARGGILIDALVGLSIDGVACTADAAFLDGTGLTAEQCRRCMRELQQLPPLPSIAEKLEVGDRYMNLDAITMVERHGLDYLIDRSFAPPSKPVSSSERAALDGLDWDLILRHFNTWYARTVAVLRIEDRAKREAMLKALDREVRQARVNAVDGGGLGVLQKVFITRKKRSQLIGDILLSLLFPFPDRSQHAAERCEQSHRNLRIAFALAAYRHDNKGYPKMLTDLVPKYLKQVPADLFTGGGVIYRPSDGGYLLYSVGVNGKDEQGRSSREKPSADDLSIRLPLLVLPRK